MAGRSYPIRRDRPAFVAEGEGRSDIESVSGLTRRIKALLETSVAPGWVRGEVSNLRVQASGHSYFSLKDADAQISCVLFRGDSMRGGGGDVLRDGAQVIVFGSISVYEPRGNYQLIVRVVMDDGLGRLQLEFERLKQRLASEGLFAPERKKPLPPAATTIGFITSPTGAAVQDFIRVLKRRQWVGRLVVLPTKVQGTGAAAEMVAALELASGLGRDGKSGGAPPTFDLLVIGRGGGSLEDLWAFNEEPLVRALAACPIPIISAVGHEIDFTLCDFAADARAETPSAAAERISTGFLDWVQRLRHAADGLDESFESFLAAGREDLRVCAARLAAASPTMRLEKAFIQCDDVQNRLESVVRHRIADTRHLLAEMRTRIARMSPDARMATVRQRLVALEARLRREKDRNLQVHLERLERAKKRLDGLDPQSVLRRGYVILRGIEGEALATRAAVMPGRKVVASFHDGDAHLRGE